MSFALLNAPGEEALNQERRGHEITDACQGHPEELALAIGDLFLAWEGERKRSEEEEDDAYASEDHGGQQEDEANDDGSPTTARPIELAVLLHQPASEQFACHTGELAPFDT